METQKIKIHNWIINIVMNTIKNNKEKKNGMTSVSVMSKIAIRIF